MARDEVFNLISIFSVLCISIYTRKFFVIMSWHIFSIEIFFFISDNNVFDGFFCDGSFQIFYI